MSAERRARRSIGRALMALGGLCLACSLALAVHNQVEDADAGSAAASAAAVLAADAGEQASPAQDAQDTPGDVVVDGVAYCGTLEIPALSLRLPVESAWDGDYEALRRAPCRQFGSAVTGDLVIAGHNYASHFGGLRNLQEGDAVYFTDVRGVTWRYQVALVEVLPPTAVDEVRTSPWALTLYTCTYGGASRVVVRCAVA